MLFGILIDRKKVNIAVIRHSFLDLKMILGVTILSDGKFNFLDIKSRQRISDKIILFIHL